MIHASCSEDSIKISDAIAAGISHQPDVYIYMIHSVVIPFRFIFGAGGRTGGRAGGRRGPLPEPPRCSALPYINIDFNV